MTALGGWIADLLSRFQAEPLKVRIAFYAGMVAALGALLASIWTVLLRAVFRMADKRRSVVRRRWTDILMQALDGENPPLPKLRRRDRRTVLGRINYLFETLTGEAHGQLRWLAYAGRLHKAVLTMITSRNSADQLIGLVSAGHLALRAAVPLALSALHDPRPAHSLAAAQALIRIDRNIAMGPVIVEFARRRDWHVARVADIIHPAALAIEDRLASIVKQIDPSERARVINLIDALGDQRGMIAVRELLTQAYSETRMDPSMLAAGIRTVSRLQDPRDTDLVLHFFDHPDTNVRRETACAIGRVGDATNAAALVVMLSDQNGWVRYEAARALVQLPGMTDATLDEIQRGVLDPVAGKILRRAIGERKAS